MRHLRIAVSQNPQRAPFPADPTLLMPAEKGLGRRLLERINPHGTYFQPPANAVGAVEILRPDASPEARIHVVGSHNHLLLIGPGLDRDDRAEWFLLDNARVVGGVIDDCRLDEIALAVNDIRLPDGELIAVLLAIFQKRLDSLVPGLVRD